MMTGGLIRVRDFAAKSGCTPQNIYGHLKTYAAELEGHTFQGKGRQGILLDGEAQDFLRSVMYPKEVGEANLMGEINSLRAELMKMGVEGTRLASELAKTEAERDKAEFEVKQLQRLLKASEEEEKAREQELNKTKKDLSEAAQEAERAKNRLNAYAEEVAAYNALPRLKRLFAKAPELREDE